MRNSETIIIRYENTVWTTLTYEYDGEGNMLNSTQETLSMYDKNTTKRTLYTLDDGEQWEEYDVQITTDMESGAK